MEGKTNYTEAELLMGLNQGSEDAFTAIYNTYWKPLYFLAHKHLSSPHAAEEVVQDVFLSIWNKRITIKIDSLPVYLAAMTRYTVYRYIARLKKLNQTTINEGDYQYYIQDQEQLFENKYLLDIIEKLSNQLPEKCRMVFINNKLLDQPLDQVAKDMNISLKTAEAHLTKALKVIRGNFGDALCVLLFL